MRAIRGVRVYRGVESRAGGVSKFVRDTLEWAEVEPHEYRGEENEISIQTLEVASTFTIVGHPYLGGTINNPTES